MVKYKKKIKYAKSVKKGGRKMHEVEVEGRIDQWVGIT